MQAYVAQPDLRPDMEPAALVAEREKAVAEARARLAGYPQPVVARFETLLKAAQVATVVHEDHDVWIDQRLFYHVRRLIIEFGQRLAQAGTLAVAIDVFYLTPEVLQNGSGVPMQRLVSERKAEMERFNRVARPPMLGTAPAFEMTGGSAIRALFKGEMSPANTRNGEAGKVKGLPGSAGVVRGTARVIHSLAEAGKLQPADVLVVIFTEPPWTPLFATASAIVPDAGGVLSHSAVVAREYRIPAVVGIGTATTTFTGEQLLEVDGNAGTVRVVEETVMAEAHPFDLRDEISAAISDLMACQRLSSLVTAVRSSAVDEDGAMASFAGQHETYLNIVGAEAIIEAIGRCWEPARSERALEYRRQ